MSVSSCSVSGCRRFFSPAHAVLRLRICYYVTLAALAVTLLVGHRLAVRAHRDARLLTVASHVCQIQAALPVVFVRVPPASELTSLKTKPDVAREEK